MPYSITTKDGIKINNIPDDVDPNSDELRQRVAQIRQQQASLQEAPEEKTSIGEEILGGLETAGTILSGAIAEPIAGVAGSLAADISAFNPELGLTPSDVGAETVKGVREALTYQPRTRAGQENIEAIGEFIEPAAEVFGAAEDVLGESTLESTGSPALAAAAKTIPTALLELGTAGAASKISKLKSGKALDNAIRESAPSSQDLKNASRQVFQEIQDAGVTVDSDQFAKLTDMVENAARDAGGRPRTTPQAFGVVDEFRDVLESGDVIDLDEIDQLRTVAQNAANTIDPAQKAPAIAIIDEIDGFLDDAGDKFLTKPEGLNVGLEYRRARDLWGRARRSEAIDELFEAAQDTASGFENGLRIEARKLIKNKKRSRFFSPREIEALKQISQGTRASNLAKLIGRLGLSEGQAINIVNPAIGGGAAFALFGAPGAVAVPVIGQVSKGLAQKLTKNNARLADQVVRAGNNAELITKAYLNNVPKAQRSALELSELLTRNQIDLNTVRSAFARDAADVARQRRAFIEGAAVGGALAPREKEE